MIRVLCLGAGGHASVVCDAMRLDQQLQPVGLLDDDTSLHGIERFGMRVLGPIDDIARAAREHNATHAAVGIGTHRADPRRAELVERIEAAGLPLATVLHPAAVVAAGVRIEPGVQIFAGATINPGAALGRNAIINTRAVIEHDAAIGAHAHVCPGAIVLGGVAVGDHAFVGAGAVIKQGLSVGERATVAAGAVVIEDVPEGATVAGVPAEPLG